jgi:2-iminobutanoate/2-iminopropanoate deaminase
MPETPTSKPAGPYTPVVRAGDWLVVSGQLGRAGDVFVDGGVAEQLTQAIVNLSDLLEAHGAALGSVVKTTVFLTDIGDYTEMNDAYMAAFGDHRPARSAIAVSALPLGGLVEIEAWAHLG